jgi:hypothetical protein
LLLFGGGFGYHQGWYSGGIGLYGGGGVGLILVVLVILLLLGRI